MLVSVVVITYNSSKFVLETLESIYAQTYKDIELIISDDCSKDNTVDICKKWCDDHRERFVSVEVIESKTNTGIAPNANRGYSHAKGEWIKGLAGDDLLLPNCIEFYLWFSENHPEFNILFSRAIPFGENHIAVCNFNKLRNGRQYFYELPTSESQYYDLLIREACMDGPSGFIRKIVYDTVDGYDESIPMYEDYPFFLKATKLGFRIGMMNDRVTQYRIHEESISYSTSKGKNLRMAKASYDVFMKYRFDSLRRLSISYAWFMKWFYQGKACRTNIARSFYYTLRMIIRVITRGKCLRLQDTRKLREQLPVALYKEYSKSYFK